MTKPCTACGLTKSASEFYTRKGGGLSSSCKSCTTERARQWRLAHPERYAELQARAAANRPKRLARYNELPDHVKLPFKQAVRSSGHAPDFESYATAPLPPPVCEVCEEERPLVADHCHETGKFRGWVCSACNGKLRWADKNGDWLGKAWRYLFEPSF